MGKLTVDKRTKPAREMVANRKREAAAEAIVKELFGDNERLVPINFLPAGTPALAIQKRDQVKKLLVTKMAAIGLAALLVSVSLLTGCVENRRPYLRPDPTIVGGAEVFVYEHAGNEYLIVKGHECVAICPALPPKAEATYAIPNPE